MNWGQLKALAIQAVNRKDIDFNGLAPLTADDISTVMVVQENEATANVVMTAAALVPPLFNGPLPAFFVRVRACFAGRRELKATDLQGLLGAVDQKTVFAISGDLLWSGQAGPLTLAYSIREVVPALDTDTSLLMSRYSPVWLYGLLRHAAHRIQDFDAEEAHAQVFIDAVASANANYELTRLASGFAPRIPYAPAGG